MARAEAMGMSDPLPPPARAPSPAAAPAPAPRAQAPAPRPPAPTIAATLVTRADDNKLFEVRSIVGGQALFARRAIASGTRLFGEDDWADETEKRSFTTLTEAQLQDLAPTMQEAFLRFAYNVSPEQIRGTFRPEGVRHPVNFINHSCEPNAGYDGADHIVALRRIAVGEEIRMDYGTYSFSFDHDFSCTCGAWACRAKVTRNDWPELVRSGLRLPGFMRALANKALWG
jgi:SET domain